MVKTKTNESIRDIGEGVQDWGSTVYVEPLGVEMSWKDVYFIVRHDCSIFPCLEELIGLGPREKPTDATIRAWIEERPKEFVEYLEEFGAYNDTFADDEYSESVSYGMSASDLDKALDDELSTPDEDDNLGPSHWDHIYYAEVSGWHDGKRVSGTSGRVFRTKELCRKWIMDFPVADYVSFFEWHGDEDGFVDHYDWSQSESEDEVMVSNKYDDLVWTVRELDPSESEHLTFKPLSTIGWVCKELDNYPL